MPGQLDWFPLYTKNFQLSRKVKRMNNEQVGMYFKLLIYQWEDGEIPDDIGEIAFICGCSADAMATAWPKIKPCFERGSNGGLVNQFLEDVRAEQEMKARNRSLAGKAGADARWGKD